jgi:hypothetical protein
MEENMKMRLCFASLALFCFFASYNLAAQRLVNIGRAYGMQKINKNEWMAKEIHVSEDNAKNTYLQLGYGRNAAGCSLTHEQTQNLLSILTESSELARNCHRQRKDMTKDFGSISQTLSAEFVSSKHGAKASLVLNMSGGAGETISLYINSQQIRHMIWLLKDEKLTYMR